MQQILENETMTTEILNAEHGKGYVVGIEKNYYVGISSCCIIIKCNIFYEK